MFDDKLEITSALRNKWQPILEHGDLDPINDPYKKNVTAILLENQQQFLNETAPANSETSGGLGSLNTGDVSSGVAGFDPILISMVRRAMPKLIAYDVAGVQPMTAPTGLIFALKANYTGITIGNSPGTRGTEALFNEALAAYGGTNGIEVGNLPTQSTDPLSGSYFTGNSFATSEAEALGDAQGNHFPEMSFSIERRSVVAQSRALKAEYTRELAQDLKAVHGLDAEAELANILSTEILQEINREVIRKIYSVAMRGASQGDISTSGTYNLINDSDGRWHAERFRGLVFQIEREANEIAKNTRRGKGNIVICNSDVASALNMAGILDSSLAQNTLNVDDTGVTFAGTIAGRLKVFIDPYATVDFACVGYKGTSPYDAGLFYCPYVPLEMVKAVGENTFQPKIAFKTRYGIVQNPFVTPITNGHDLGGVASPAVNQNEYYRIFAISNLHGIHAGAT